MSDATKDLESQALLIELGCEEVPASIAPRAAKALLDGLVRLLDAAGLSHGEARWLGTPRRLTAHIEAVQVRQPDRVDELVGPPARVAFDTDGNPTRAALGFARGQGVDPSGLYVLETPKGDYAAAKKSVSGERADVLLAAALPDLLRNLPMPKRMKWGRQAEPFIRPVHSLVAILGDRVIDVEFAGVRAGRDAAGHRFLGGPVPLLTADYALYVALLRVAHVMVDPAERRAVILAAAETLAAEAGGTLVDDPVTLDVVTWLVEWPFPLLGTFSAAFLEIPDEVTIITLREHQKLFTIRGADGKLLNRFVAVANTLSEQSRAVVAEGNARVVSARLSDARFFYDVDRSKPLADFVAKLDGRIYLQGLGSTLAKVARLEALADHLAAEVCPDHATTTRRAAHLCKADLATQMVVEFTALQGQIGADYARCAGESDAVADAIAEHYQPRFAGDAVPATAPGAVVAIADKLDAIVSCFGLGLIPSGSQDPYALRRSALGIVQILVAKGWRISLSGLIAAAVEAIDDGDLITRGDALIEQVLAFFEGRLKHWLSENQSSQLYAADTVEAVLAAGFDDVPAVFDRAAALATARRGDTFLPLAAAFKRVANLVKKADAGPDARVDEALFELDAERGLYSAATALSGGLDAQLSDGDWDGALSALATLKPEVDRFFDDVMVMHEDPALRRNRLALLQHTAQLFARIADFSRIQA